MFDPYDILLVNRMGNLIDEGWVLGAGGPYVDYWKAYEAVSTRYGYPKPRIIETFRKTGVLARDPEDGYEYVDTKKVLQLCPYLINKLANAPGRVLLRRTPGMVPAK